jgi:hypothetical protein
MRLEYFSASPSSDATRQNESISSGVFLPRPPFPPQT